MRDATYPVLAPVLEPVVETPVQTAGREAEERWKRTGFAGGGVVRGVVVVSWCVLRGWRCSVGRSCGFGSGALRVVARVAVGLARACVRGVVLVVSWFVWGWGVVF
jgi:hypothetical protein